MSQLTHDDVDDGDDDGDVDDDVDDDDDGDDVDDDDYERDWMQVGASGTCGSDILNKPMLNI